VIVVALACAGALGAPSRYLLEAAISRRAGHEFPWGTACVNLLGSFALGFLVGLREFQGLDGDLSTIAGIGFLGAFTTFSTFAVETTRLTPRSRVLYIGISVVGGIACAALGLALASV
jgi:CrcB protein